MKKLLGLLTGFSLYYASFAQISFTGSSSSISTGTSAATVIVDDALIVTAVTTFDGARVYIATNFVNGDVLGYTNALLPSGVSGSYNSSTGVLTFTGTATASAYQTLLRSVTFTATATGVGDRVVIFSLGTAFFNNTNNHFYQYIAGSLTWTAAKAGAASKNYYGLTGYLATITSLSENQFIQQKLATSGWIGASDNYTVINTATGTSYIDQSATEGKFYWVTGPEAGTLFSTGNNSPVTASGQFSNWNSGEPNNWAGAEHYVALYTNGAWNDGSDAGDVSTSGYIIEYGGLSGDPLVDLVHSRTVTVANTSLSATTGNNFYALKSPVVVDNAVVVASGGMITNARITISGNFMPGDALSFSSSALPAGVTGSYNSSTGVLSFTGTASPADWQAIFRTVVFQSTSSSSSDRTLSFSCGNLISGNNGHFYEFIPSTTNWTVAKAAAEAKNYMGLQGYLATITSKAENDLIWQKLSADGWLGGSDQYSAINTAASNTLYADQSAAEGNFYWVTGPEAGQIISSGNYPSTTSISYSNWYGGEPNNYNNNEHYIEIYSSSSQPGTWNDLPVNNHVGYVVEYGGLPTDPGVVLSVSRTLVIVTLLPVQNLQLDLEQKNNSVILFWSVDEAKDIDRYEVLYSATGTTFNKIGEVKAAAAEKWKYSFVDNGKLLSKNYYRIAAVDNNGNKMYSEIRSISIKNHLTLTPSIVQHQFAINQSEASLLNICLFNTNGSLALQKTTKLLYITIDTSNLQSGIYFVVISNESKETNVFRIVKD